MSLDVNGFATIAPATQRQKPDPLRAAAVQLEATFLAEMLKSAGLDKTDGPFGGGEGEAQFSSLLIREQANAMAQAGGIGLAENLYEALKEMQDDS